MKSSSPWGAKKEFEDMFKGSYVDFMNQVYNHKRNIKLYSSHNTEASILFFG